MAERLVALERVHDGRNTLIRAHHDKWIGPVHASIVVDDEHDTMPFVTGGPRCTIVRRR